MQDITLHDRTSRFTLFMQYFTHILYLSGQKLLGCEPDSVLYLNVLNIIACNCSGLMKMPVGIFYTQFWRAWPCRIVSSRCNNLIFNFQF